MTAPTVVWGVLADADGLCRWVRHEGALVDGHLQGRRSDQWANDPADSYAAIHPAPLEFRWCHNDPIGRVVALRSMHGKLLGVCETDLTPDDLEALTATYGPLRFSPSTSKVGRQPLEIREVSLTPRPASVGLGEVHWHHPRTSKGNLPAWVAADLTRGSHDRGRHRPTIEVYERDGTSRETEQQALRRHLNRPADEWGSNPREVHIAAATGHVIAVAGRPPR